MIFLQILKILFSSFCRGKSINDPVFVVLSFDNLVVSVVVTILDLSMGDQSLIRILVGLVSQITNRDPVHGPQRRMHIPKIVCR